MCLQDARLVVGFDGSPAARGALRWARDIWADPAGVRVAAVHVRRPEAGVLPDAGVVDVTSAGAAAEALVALAARADALVVGASARAAAPGRSLPVTLATRARRPVGIGPDAGPAGPALRRVVVGVDGSPESLAAVDVARAQAARADAPVLAVPCRDAAEAPRGVPDRPDVAADLDEARAGHAVDVTYRVVDAAPAAALASFCAPDALVVVGGRGCGGSAGMLLGSVGRDLIQRADGPVAVVRDAGSSEPTPDERTPL